LEAAGIEFIDDNGGGAGDRHTTFRRCTLPFAGIYFNRYFMAFLAQIVFLRSFAFAAIRIIC